LFSESNSRWVIELRKGREKLLPRDRKVKATRLGTVGGDRLTISSNKKLIDLGVAELAESFNSTLWRMLG
jgi:hypothetical protein